MCGMCPREREAFFLSLVAGIFGADRFYLGLWVSGCLGEDWKKLFVASSNSCDKAQAPFQGPGFSVSFAVSS